MSQTILPWCTGNDVLQRMGEDAHATGLNMAKVDAYAVMASDVLYVLSGRQFKGSATRTVTARVGHGRGDARGAKVSLGPWWPVTGVSAVTGIPLRGTPVVLDPADWSWSGGIGLTVPHRYANQRVEALLVYGQNPPPMGRTAAIAMAAELSVNDPEYTGEIDSRLPNLMTSRSRQGITETFATVLDVMKEGATGIQEVDLFVTQYNVGHSRSRPKVRTMR